LAGVFQGLIRPPETAAFFYLQIIVAFTGVYPYLWAVEGFESPAFWPGGFPSSHIQDWFFGTRY
jgi:hypothetical protein